MAFEINEEAKDYATWKNERKSKGSFGIHVSTGDAVGFSGIPGKATYTFNFGKKIKGQQFKKEKTGPAEKPTAVQDGPKPKPKPVTGKQATTADVEKAISAGYITPEEATGGDWGKGPALSTTYSKKSAANASANNGVNVGKQFTGVRAGQPIPDQSNGAINYDKAPDNRPSNGAVNLDNIK
jgi:hypothetical protein